MRSTLALWRHLALQNLNDKPESIVLIHSNPWMAQFFSSVPEKVPIIQSAFLTWSRFYESFVTLTSAYHQISDQSLGSSKTCWNISEDVLLCLHGRLWLIPRLLLDQKWQNVSVGSQIPWANLFFLQRRARRFAVVKCNWPKVTQMVNGKAISNKPSVFLF